MKLPYDKMKFDIVCNQCHSRAHQYFPSLVDDDVGQDSRLPTTIEEDKSNTANLLSEEDQPNVTLSSKSSMRMKSEEA